MEVKIEICIEASVEIEMRTGTNREIPCVMSVSYEPYNA